MIYRMEAAGEPRTVEVRRSGDRLMATVDGVEHEADIATIGTTSSLLLAGASYEVAVVEAEAGELTVYVDGRAVRVRVEMRDTRHARREAGSAAGQVRVAAPMPGRIVKVLVKAGDTVAARQGVVVVEAMKMENELRSPRAGTVGEVRVVEGQSVEAGATLVVVQ